MAFLRALDCIHTQEVEAFLHNRAKTALPLLVAAADMGNCYVGSNIVRTPWAQQEVLCCFVAQQPQVVQGQLLPTAEHGCCAKRASTACCGHNARQTHARRRNASCNATTTAPKNCVTGNKGALLGLCCR